MACIGTYVDEKGLARLTVKQGVSCPKKREYKPLPEEI